MRIVADVGCPQYYKRRAREELLQDEPNLIFAIQLLVLAKAEGDFHAELISQVERANSEEATSPS